MYDGYSDKPYVGFFSFDQPSLLVRDLELIRDILVKDSNVFADRNTTINTTADPMFGKSLGAVRGLRWRQLRVNLTPVFTSGKMKTMFYLVDLCCKDLVDHLDTETAEGKRLLKTSSPSCKI
jgi:cytochrome P450 family 6